MVSTEVAIPCGIVLATYVLMGLWSRRRRLPKPPGPSFREIDPKTLAVLPWKVFSQWSSKYGPIISWSMFGKTTVVINSAKVVQDLLETRSSIYSDRPLSIMTGVLADRKDIVFSISSQKPRFKMYRRLMNGGLSPKVILDYRSIQLDELHRFMRAIEKTPERFKQEVKRNACAVIMKVTYGYELGGYEDEFVKIIEDGFDLFVRLQTPGRWWVEFFPWLRFVPQWFPGAGFKKFASEARETLRLVDGKPYKWARTQIDSGKHIESFISKQLEEETPYIPVELKEDVLKWVSAALYAGGADTTVSAFTSLFYVMQLHPEVQRKAQKEIESVTGGHRLPTFDDYDSLPYVRAVIKEILRWGTVAPLGLPHSVIQDDVYEGYLIPKGAKVISNIWAIVHDPELYPEPFHFDPERHLGENPQPDPFKYVWGFGRRTCPGAHLAQMSLFINISNVLAVFDISKDIGADGKQIEPPQLWTTSVTSHLEGFPCQIKVRSPDLLASIPS